VPMRPRAIRLIGTCASATRVHEPPPPRCAPPSPTSSLCEPLCLLGASPHVRAVASSAPTGVCPVFVALRVCLVTTARCVVSWHTSNEAWVCQRFSSVASVRPLARAHRVPRPAFAPGVHETGTMGLMDDTPGYRRQLRVDVRAPGGVEAIRVLVPWRERAATELFARVAEAQVRN
jgi:hypothetical protein